MASLSYDNTGLRAEEIGEDYGISRQRRSRIGARAVQARDAVVEAHEEGTLGFLDLPDEDPAGIEKWASRKIDARWTDAVVLGIGGSSLGARAVYDTAMPDEVDGLNLHVSENVDPDSVGRLLDDVPLDTTLFVVVTKSGTTIETMGQFAIVFERLKERLGPGRASDQIVAVTSPDSGALRELARSNGFETFSIPPNVGGRFSVLTPVGLVPLALAGYPVGQLLKGARLARDRALEAPYEENAVLQAATDAFALYKDGMSQLVMMAYSDRLETLVDWFRQLWAESLGKATDRQGEQVHVGMTPVKAVGTIDQHSQVQLYMEGPANRLVTFLGVESFDTEVTIPEADILPEALSHLGGRSLAEVLNAELDGTQQALGEVGRPTNRWTFEQIRPRSVGAFLLSWELITGMMGELLDINAYDQPGVELGKNIAHGRLGHPDHREYQRDDGEGESPLFVVGEG
jgi:glucose-6-phosphate isomerase